MFSELVASFISSISLNVNGKLVLNENLVDYLPNSSLIEKLDLNNEKEVEDFLLKYEQASLENLGLIDTTQAINYGESENYLNSNYKEYLWTKLDEKMISNVSGGIPIDMHSELFPTSDIDIAINNSFIESSYGGCAPIAMIGIGDYFSRFLGYNELISDVNSRTSRINFATNVFKLCKTYQVGDSTLINVSMGLSKQF